MSMIVITEDDNEYDNDCEDGNDDNDDDDDDDDNDGIHPKYLRNEYL